MAAGKLKIVSRTASAATAKAAQPGSKQTGAKVTKTKAGKGQPGSAQGRFIGTTTGLSVLKYQNKSLEDNRKRHRTDEQLAKEWRDEFPNAKADYTADTVAGVRGAYNRGKHGNEIPREPIREYDADGDALMLRGEAAAERRAAKAAKTEAKPVAKGVTKTAPAKAPAKAAPPKKVVKKLVKK